MADVHEQGGAAATTGGQPSQGQPGQGQPSDEEMRAAYEAELNRISSTEMILQTAVSLLNIGGRRLGLAAAPPGAGGPSTDSERDLDQVRDAIDGASALIPILERRMPGELGPLRDAIAQLQVAYAREAQGAGASSAAAPAASPGSNQASQPPEAAKGEAPETPGSKPPEGPGPAQASGRLWVPGR